MRAIRDTAPSQEASQNGQMRKLEGSVSKCIGLGKENNGLPVEVKVFSTPLSFHFA